MSTPYDKMLFVHLFMIFLLLKDNIFVFSVLGTSTDSVHSTEYPRNPSMVDLKLTWGRSNMCLLFVCLQYF